MIPDNVHILDKNNPWLIQKKHKPMMRNKCVPISLEFIWYSIIDFWTWAQPPQHMKNKWEKYVISLSGNWVYMYITAANHYLSQMENF